MGASLYLLQHLSGKFQMAQLLLMGCCDLSVGLEQVILLVGTQVGQQRSALQDAALGQGLLQGPPGSHLGLDALLQGRPMGVPGDRRHVGQL